MRSVETVVLLVAVATVVAAFAGRLRVPAPSLLVVAGVAAGLLPGAPPVHVPPAVVSLVVLPPLLYAASEELAWRDVRAVIFVLESVVFSLIGLEPLARFAGFGHARSAGPLREETIARLRLAEAGLARLDELAEDDVAPDAVIDRLRAGLQARVGNNRARMDHDPETAREAVTERELRGELIAAENAELSRLFDTGTISAATRRRLQRSLDLEAARLAEGRP